MTDFATIEALRLQGLSFSQIGERFGITKDAARGIYTRGLAGRERTQPAGLAPAAVCRCADAAPAADGGDRGRDVLLHAGTPGQDRPGDLHAELASVGPACKLCRYLAAIAPAMREEWEREMALPVTEIAHTSIVAALKRRGVSVGESSVKRHRDNHVAR